MSTNVRVAVVQMNSQNEVAKNLAVVRARVREAAEGGAKLVLLPENFAFMGGTDEERVIASEPVPGDGPIVSTLRSLAKEHHVAIIGGGMPEASGEAARPHNSLVAVDEHGEISAKYRKIHLFDVDVKDGQTYRESAAVTAGKEPVVATIAGLKVGLSICYDVRFPELYRKLVDLGAEVLVVPAAFTLMTGKDHWHVLLRARAIESQCWVLAAAQHGAHPRNRQTYGKSLVVDPWGDVVAQASEGEGLVFAQIDTARTEKVRASLPSLKHRVLT